MMHSLPLSKARSSGEQALDSALLMERSNILTTGIAPNRNSSLQLEEYLVRSVN